MKSDWTVLVLVGVVFLIGTLIFWRALLADENAKINETTTAEAELIARHLESELNNHIQVLARITDRWEFSGRPTSTDWKRAAELNVDDFPGFHSIQWMNADGEAEWVVPWELAGELTGFDHRSLPEFAAALALARESDQSAASEPVEMAPGEWRFAVYHPVYVSPDPAMPEVYAPVDNFDGYIAGTFSTAELFDLLLDEPAFEGYGVVVSSAEHDVFVLAEDDRQHEEVHSAEEPFIAAGSEWRVRVWPERSELGEQQSGLPTISLVMGLVLMILILALVRLLQTTRQRVEESSALNVELNQITSALQESNRGLEEFTYVASHDLKTPLVTLQGMADVLTEDFGKDLPAEGQLYLQRIKANANRMQNLLDDVLKISRMRQEGEVVGTVDLDALVRAELEEMEEWFSEHDAEVRIPEPLPMVQANAERLSQIVSNLIRNGVAYVPSGRVPVIEITCRRHDADWIIFVSDNGWGIPEESRDRVFRMFQRLPNGIGANPAGTGMGLAIVARAVESHGGQIWIHQTGDAGTTFAFTVPAAATETTG